MLTRLKVSGFKNLVDVDVYFGPFTCVAGANALGKSNLFDAIHFLSALADRLLVDAALSVRDDGGRTSDVKSLFHRVGDDFDKEMFFEAEMIIPREGWDDLGQKSLKRSEKSAKRMQSDSVKSFRTFWTALLMAERSILRNRATSLPEIDRSRMAIWPTSERARAISCRRVRLASSFCRYPNVRKRLPPPQTGRDQLHEISILLTKNRFEAVLKKILLSVRFLG